MFRWEALAPQVLAALPVPVVLTDRGGVICYVNAAFTRVTGYAPEEVLGGTPRVLKSGVHGAEFYAGLWQTIVAGRPWQGEVVNRRKSGELYTDLQHIVPLAGPDGQITHFLAVKTDVPAHVRALTATAPVGIFHADAEGRWTYVNDRLAQLTGRAFDDLIGDGWTEAVDERDRRNVQTAWRALVGNAARDVAVLARLRRFEGPEHWVQMRAVRAPHGEPAVGSGIVGSVEDVEELIRTREQLTAREAHLQAILQTAPDGVIVVDARGIVESMNEAAEALFGWAERDVTGRHVGLLMPQLETRGDDSLPFGDIGRAGDAGRPEELAALHRAGGTLPVELTVSEATVGDHKVFVCIVRDVTQRKADEAELRFRALHDPLTGLANRTLLDDRLDHALRASRRSGQPLALLLLDLDRFKAVNDRGGHAAGDEALVKVAETLASAVRADDTVARIGGDEFVVLTYPVADLAGVEQLAGRIVAALAHGDAPPVEGVSASVGVVVARGGSSADDVLRRADAAMYEAKAAGRNRYVVAQEHDESPA